MGKRKVLLARELKLEKHDPRVNYIVANALGQCKRSGPMCIANSAGILERPHPI